MFPACGLMDCDPGGGRGQGQVGLQLDEYSVDIYRSCLLRVQAAEHPRAHQAAQHRVQLQLPALLAGSGGGGGGGAGEGGGGGGSGVQRARPQHGPGQEAIRRQAAQDLLHHQREGQDQE